MKNIKLFFIFIILGSLSNIFAQEHLQATIKKVSDNCIDVYAKPDIDINAAPLGYVISVRWPTQGEAVTANIYDLLTGMGIQNPIDQHSSGGYTYQDYNINQVGSPPSVNWIANNEYKIGKICFDGNSTNSSLIQQVDEDGGASGWVFWYFQFVGSLDDVTNYTNPFYASPGKSTANNNGNPQYAETTETVAIPLTLSNFTAKRYNRTSSYLSWDSEDEVNFDRFEIERSTGFNDWEYAGTVKGSGTDRGTKSYSFIDKDVYNNLGYQAFYYRLKIIDLDGRYVYSDARVVEFDSENKTPNLQVFPNPASDKVYFTLMGIDRDSELSIDIYDNTGRLVMNKSLTYQGYKNVLINNAKERLRAGIYNVIISDKNKNRFFKKLVLTR